MELSLIQVIAVYALPVIFAITLHEAAHGYVAKHFGDLTAYSQGRVSLNPIRHIDPVGTVALPLFLSVLSKFIPGVMPFGWAKPVPVNFGNLRNPKRDMLWVAAAGPAANLVMAIFWVLMIKLSLFQGVGSFSKPLALMGTAGVEINAVFIVLNLLPIPPLDGGRIVTSLLPGRLAYRFSRIEPYGFFIILTLLFTNVLSYVILPGMVLITFFLAWMLDVPIVEIYKLSKILSSS